MLEDFNAVDALVGFILLAVLWLVGQVQRMSAKIGKMDGRLEVFGAANVSLTDTKLAVAKLETRVDALEGAD